MRIFSAFLAVEINPAFPACRQLNAPQEKTAGAMIDGAFVDRLLGA
jgi:hypothetical protein